MVCKYSWLTFNTSSARHKLWLSVREERGEIFPLSVSSVPSQTQSDLIMVLECFNVAKVYSLERVSSFDLSSPLNWTLTKFSFLYKLWKFPSLNAHNLIWGRFHQDMSHSRLICRTVGVWERCERFGESRGGHSPVLMINEFLVSPGLSSHISPLRSSHCSHFISLVLMSPDLYHN